MTAINIKNTDKLQARLDEVQKKARVRTITVDDIREHLAAIEKGLNIAKKNMVGIRVSVDPNGQKFPNAYKGTPESTQFDAEYRASGWYITDISRYHCDTQVYRIKLTDDAKLSIFFRISKGIF